MIADLETLLGQPGSEPAELAGFGPIGRDLLGYLACTGDLAGVLADGHTSGPTPQANILNVGRTSRLATARQRAAVYARQNGHCANPDCTNTSLDIHHVAWWDRDHGATDLSNLIGLCSGCHHLVHRQKLTIRPDGHGGFGFHRTTGHRIDDHARTNRHRIRQALRRLLHETRHETAERQTPEPEPEPEPTSPPNPEPEPRTAMAPPPAAAENDARTRRLRGCGYQLSRIRYTDLNDTDPPPTHR